MLKKSASVISLSVLSILFIVFAFSLIIKVVPGDPRQKYESFLVKAGDQFKPELTEGEEENPSCDRPDEAAFDEYIKTMDPVTRQVPVERRFSALEEARALMSLKSSASGLLWESQRADMGGRTRMMMLDPNDPNGLAMFAGSVTGGLWYNENPLEEADWQPISDFWANLSISSMCYDPANPKHMFLGTGESETALITYRESSGRGNGLYHSTDGGHTWDQLPSTNGWAYVTDLEMRVENGTSVLYAGVVSGYYKGKIHVNAPSDGLYRSTDQGLTWSQVMPLIPGTQTPFAPADICLSADRSRIFVGTTYGIKADGTDNDRSGAACILWSDDGLTWNLNQEYRQAIAAKTDVNLPGRVMITEAPSNPNILYAIIASGYPAGPFYGYGCEYLLKTTDKGQTWTALNFPAGFATLAWHAFAININPQDPNIIWVGGLDTYRSLDGGTNWQKISNWALMYGTGGPQYVHADIHQIMHHPQNGRMLYVASDGGIFVTGSSTSPDNVIFTELNQNFNTLQYYSCAISPVEGKNEFMGGLQDNGTMHYKPGDIPNVRDQLSGGDGAFCFFDNDNPDWYLTCSQYSTIYLYKNQGGPKPIAWNAAQTGLGIFVNPMDYDWKNNRLYVNASYFTGNLANQIAVINMAENQITGFLKNIGSQTQMPFTAVKFAESPVNGGLLFLGTASGELYKLAKPDTDSSAQNITGNNFPVGYLGSIEIGQTPDTLLITYSNYGIPSVFLSTNGGQTWSNIEGNLPDMPVRYGIFHPKSSRYAMLATETGTWTTDDILAPNVVWTPQVNGMANVRVDMLKVRPSDLKVVAATHGRGLYTTTWKVGGTSSTGEIIAGREFNVYPNPSAGPFTIETNLQKQAFLTIMDVRGRVVRMLSVEPGSQSLKVDLSKEGKGTYYARIGSAESGTTAATLIVN